MLLIARILATTVVFMSPALARANSAVGCGPLGASPSRYILRLNLHAPMTAGASAKSIGELDAILSNSDKTTSWIHSKTAASGALRTMETDTETTLLAAQLDPAAREAIQGDPRVLSIEPDCLVSASALPNDPQAVANSWAIRAMNLDNAWNEIHEAPAVIVAVSDTGVDYSHEDLSENMWTNRSELGGATGVDDDGNGCIDDIHGCDFADNDGDPTPGPLDSAKHGTHVAGIIGAVGNNGKGVTGVAWRTQIMAVKGFSNLSDTAKSSDLLKTIYYAVDNGARIINCSWGTERLPSQAEIQAFRYALSKNVLPVVAAGNDGADAATTSPAAIAGVMAVGAIGSHERVSGFSNFGKTVSIYAPGGDATSVGGVADEFIFSTLPMSKGAYGNLRGTSMAAPFISGLAALILSARPELLAQDVAQVITASARKVRSLLPDGTSGTISIPDAQAAIALARTTIPSSKALPSCDQAPDTCTVPQPKTQPGDSTQYNSTTESTTTGCGLVRASGRREPINPNATLLLFIPLLAAMLLRRKQIA